MESFHLKSVYDLEFMNQESEMGCPGTSSIYKNYKIKNKKAQRTKNIL